MKLQNLLLPKAGVCCQIEMYIRMNDRVRLTDCNRTLTFRNDGICSFDTYFNGLSIEKWLKYTEVKQISLVLKLEGSFEIQLVSKEKIHGIISEKVLDIQCFNSVKLAEITIPFHSYDNKGMFFFKLIALSPKAKFCGGYYETNLQDNNLDLVNLAVNICTFRREAFVQRNLEMLKTEILENSENVLSDHLHIFISDNGKTLDIKKLSTEKIHIEPNKNVGGAGGFTRGLIEIMKCQNYQATHVLFMDDDILIETESLFRTYAILRCVKSEYREAFIGGAMLRLDQQNIQVESGASWNAGNLHSLKCGLNLNTVDACLYNEVEEYTEFNAWWYCCMPMSLVNEKNLPLPIFIRGDDLEYGLRNMKNLILLNGVCVWHEPFENKYSSFLEYYILRNLLYDNAAHFPNYSKWRFLRRFCSSVLRNIIYYRYKNVDLIFRGVEDFFRGVDFLKGTDAEQLHKDVMASGYKAQPLEKLPMLFEYCAYDQSFVDRGENKLHKLLRIITINGLFLPAKRNVITSMALCRPVNFYRAKSVMQYDVTSKKAFITEKSLRDSLKYLFRLAVFGIKVLAHWKKGILQFRKNIGTITDINFWIEYLK